MDNKTAIFIIVIALILVGLSYYTGLNIGAQRVLGQIPTTPAQIPETEFSQLLKAGVIDVSAHTYGKVKEISDKNIKLVRILEDGSESQLFSIEIKDNAKIVKEYILGAGAEKEEIKGTIEASDGKKINLGEKEIKLEDIQIGDDVFINLELLADGSYQGNSIIVTSANLLEG